MNDQQRSRADALTDLLPCPFCGCAPEHIQGLPPLDDSHFIDCPGCGMSSKITGSKEAALAAWNQRAASPSSQPAAAPILCKFCGSKGHSDDDCDALPRSSAPADERAAPNTITIRIDKDRFERLMDALDRAESKGYLPDAMADEWNAFEWEVMPAARASSANATGAEAHKLLAALIDIYDDGQNNAPEDRCYVEGAWTETINEARAFLVFYPDAPAQAAEPVAWMVLASNTRQPCEVTLYKSETDALRQDCVIPLYAAPQPPAQASQPEPRDEVTDCGCATNEACKMKTDGSCWRAD